MKRTFTLLCSLCLFLTFSFGQVYVDEFDNDDPAFMGGAGSYAFEESNNELTISATNTGPWDVFTYQFHDPSSANAITVDATGNNKVYIRAKASNVGVQLRMDLQDINGYVTSLAGISKILTTDYQILEFDFTGLYQDGGYGGTACDAGPCPVDGEQLSQAVFFTDPGVGGFNGSVVIDYIAFGEEPDGVIMSEVFQDHFDVDSSLTSFTGAATYSLSLNDNSELIIAGDGSNPMWDPLSYTIRSAATYDPIDIDVTANNKMYIKVKSTVPNTAIRFDLIDIDGFANTQGSITKLVGTDYEVIEFDFAGTYIDLGFGGTPCTADTAPCPVDGTRIAQLNLFIEPGVGEFLGELTIDYISFDIPLEPAGPSADLIYQDHFNNENLEFTADAPGLAVAEMESDLIITGDGTAEAFAAISYELHDKDLNEQIVLDMAPGQDKVFVRARTEVGSVPLRIDLIDTAGYTTNQASLTKIISNEFETFEYNFTGNYFDGGFGGTPCDAGPCEVDASAIDQLLIYVDPVAGAFDGTVYIDFISVGQPAESDAGVVGIPNYSDQMDDETINFVTDANGLSSNFMDDEWTITGDGNSDMWTAINYGIHNEAGELIIASAVASNDVLYVRAKTSVVGTQLRVDLQDQDGFVTNAAAVANTLSENYQVFEINFSANYNDGGFGGTPCDAGPCPVDGDRIANLQFFINPGVGAFDGTVTIDWVSFGQPLGNSGPTGVINYFDEIDANTVLFIDDSDGFTSTTDDIWTISGDGSGTPYAPVVYATHDDNGALLSVDAVGSSNLLYIMARGSEEVNLRIDLQDEEGFVTNANAQSVDLTTAFEIYELNYAGAYNDGGFGGTPCDAGPCPVDGQRIANLQFFANAATGGFAGDIEIDWIAFGMPIVGIPNQERLNTLTAYPNPVIDQLNVVFETTQASEVEIWLVNSLGQTIQRTGLGNMPAGRLTHSLDVSKFDAGMYTLMLRVDGVMGGFLKFIK
ncbi:MAG: T9SS type A sorting domain-containing protein [Saprospiraceae bacterium]|nr:T9SS type A sorting domain-containing protein [Saprospiraceae bacterium]